MSRTTQTLIGKKALDAIFRGVNSVYEPVRRTFGPEGRNALLFRTWNRGSRITNDGVTVAECQTPRNPHERLVAEAFKEASKKTNERCGDGTTLTSILAGKLFNSVYRLLSEQDSAIKIGGAISVGSMTLRRQILESAAKVKALVKEMAHKTETLEDLEKIATVSVEDAELGKRIAEMAWEVGVDGFIDVVEGYKGEIETEIIKGMRFPAKVAAKGFVNNSARFEMIAKDCPVFITNYALDNAVQLSKVINPFLTKNPKLIIIAPSFSETVLTDIFNAMFSITQDGQKVKKPLVDIFPVAVPSLRTEQLEDLATYCGARFVDKAKGSKLQNAGIESLGFLEKLVVKDTEAKEDAMAIGGAGTQLENKAQIPEKNPGFVGEEDVTPKKTAIEERIEMLKSQMEETREDRFKKLLERRIASISSAVGIIRVGDSTQASSLYRKLKIEDAVFACKAALRGGYVRGGGLCLKEIAEKLPDSDIIKAALLAPYEQIQASVDGGFEIGEDILDPAEVIYYAVEHATQVVAQLATVESITIEEEDQSPTEGYMAIAHWLREFVISDKIAKGQLKENEAEAYRDNNGGLTEDELVALDRG